MSVTFTIPNDVKQEKIGNGEAFLYNEDIFTAKRSLLYEGTKKEKSLLKQWENDGKNKVKLYGFACTLTSKGKVDRLYVALRSTFGDIGDKITIKFNDGTEAKCIIAAHIKEKYPSKIKNSELLNKYGYIDNILVDTHTGKINIVLWLSGISLLGNPYKGKKVSAIVNSTKKKGGTSDKPDGNAGGGDEEETSYIDMRERIAKLYTSDNYTFINESILDQNKKTSPIQALIDNLKDKVLSNLQLTNKALTDDDGSGKALAELFKSEVGKVILNKNVGTSITSYERKKAEFEKSNLLVEAPFVTIQIGQIVIGSYQGKGTNIDKYPNYVNRLAVQKTNGKINNYVIELVHQIRVGDDPNLLDKVFASNQFKKIIISYGDTNTGQMFDDTEAIITNVTMNRDYASARITYTVEATSAGNYLTSHITNFPAVTDKPSNQIKKLLYSSTYSDEFKKAFPTMASETKVMSKGLIPVNDKEIYIPAKENIDPISYMSFLVSCMSNDSNSSSSIIRKSSYFLFFTDNQQGGAGFEIREISQGQSSNSVNSLFEVTVGYPDNNNIFSFSINNDQSWAIMYEKNIAASLGDEYVYTIMDNGDIDKYYSPNLVTSSNVITEQEKNWWTFMVSFPITATLTMRGLLRPAFITNYIKINVVFYGQKHIASGLYAITEQRDTLDGNGFRTSFSLVRIGEE